MCRTQFSGIRPEDIEKGDSFEKVKKEVVEIVRNKIVVGHSIEYDLASLKINPAGTVYMLGQYRLFFLRLIAQSFTQIYMNCFVNS